MMNTVQLGIHISHKTFLQFTTATFQSQVFQSDERLFNLFTLRLDFPLKWQNICEFESMPSTITVSLHTGTNEHQAIYGTGFEEKYKTHRPPVVKSLGDLTIYDPRRQREKPRIIHFGADFNSHTTTPSTSIASTPIPSVSISSLAPTHSLPTSPYPFYSSTPYPQSPATTPEPHFSSSLPPLHHPTPTPFYSTTPSPIYTSTPLTHYSSTPYPSTTAGIPQESVKKCYYFQYN